jgi:hypothetical protein
LPSTNVGCLRAGKLRYRGFSFPAMCPLCPLVPLVPLDCSIMYLLVFAILVQGVLEQIMKRSWVKTV